MRQTDTPLTSTDSIEFGTPVDANMSHYLRFRMQLQTQGRDLLCRQLPKPGDPLRLDGLFQGCPLSSKRGGSWDFCGKGEANLQVHSRRDPGDGNSKGHKFASGGSQGSGRVAKLASNTQKVDRMATALHLLQACDWGCRCFCQTFPSLCRPCERQCTDA